MSRIKKFLLNIWYGLPFGMKAAGDEILGSGTADENGTSITKETEDQRVGKHLLKGEVTQEVEELRYRTYKVANESENFNYLGNGVAIKDEKGKTFDNGNRRIRFSQENKLLCATVLEEFKRMNDYGTERYVLEMTYDGIVKFKLEQFATLIDVLIDDHDKFIVETSLHFEKQANPYNAKSKPFINALSALKDVKSEAEISRNEIASSLVGIGFTTYKADGEDNFVNYLFTSDCKFKGLKETEHEYILTYSWGGYIRVPLNLEEKYYSKEMDEKYQKKERKETPVEMVNTERKAYCSVCGKEVSVYDADIMSANGEQVVCQDCLKKALDNNTLKE